MIVSLLARMVTWPVGAVGALVLAIADVTRSAVLISTAKALIDLRWSLYLWLTEATR